jgi:hypothetical protein
MDWVYRGFILAAAFAGFYLVNIFVLGNSGDALPGSARMGDWRKAEIRQTCMDATEDPRADPLMPKRQASADSFGILDYNEAILKIAAMNCYVVKHKTAICEPNNRAYIVDYAARYYGTQRDMLKNAQNSRAEKLVRAFWNNPRTRAIQAALEDHIQAGRLNERDFGWSTPAEIKPLLDRHAAIVTDCAPVLTSQVR